MKVACLQMDMKFECPDENFVKAVDLVRQAAKEGIDVAVLPETWNTGFFPKQNLAALADQDGLRVKQTFGPLAKELGLNIIAGSVANKKSDGVYNSAYVFDRQGNCVDSSDKTHLFSPMDEDKYIEKGSKTCTFELDGNKCALIICYDVRFPEFTRTMTVKGVDILFMVSQWPLVRVPHLDALTKARAIENQAFVVCWNAAGTAGETKYGGNSSVNDPWGVTIAHANGDKQEIIFADCDTTILEGIRNSINVFRDRRPEIYKVN